MNLDNVPILKEGPINFDEYRRRRAEVAYDSGNILPEIYYVTGYIPGILDAGMDIDISRGVRRWGSETEKRLLVIGGVFVRKEVGAEEILDVNKIEQIPLDDILEYNEPGAH